MPKFQITFLTPAWRDLDQISDLHLMLAGPQSAEKITDQLLETIGLLAEYPYMGAVHPDPVLSQNQFRKVICGNYVCVYKVINDTVYIYRIVDGRTDYPKLLQ